tara:strand:- start:30334 stop:31296 length:963 start_codon:yes stop_codon:yes gene_type:complete
MASQSYSNSGYPGIAASTGTRVDSAAKHIMACKVNSDLLGMWCDDRNVLHSNKMKYCMHRDELVMNVGQALNTTSVMSKQGHAYPSVLTTLGDLMKGSKILLLQLYHTSRTGRQWMQNKENLTVQSYTDKVASECKCDKQKLWIQARSMPYFNAQGYALGQAWASYLSGDTVASVMIGGMATVMNGHFECRAGQVLQWYFDFEANNFESQTVKHRGVTLPAGTRKDSNSAEPGVDLPNTDESTRLRKSYNDRQFGNPNSFGEVEGSGPSSVKTNVFFPKPYLLRADGTEHYADKIRIFAKCVNGARPHEMMDIMLLTQSL